METAATVTEAMKLLEADGYRSDFSFTDGAVRCVACNTSHAPPQLLVALGTAAVRNPCFSGTAKNAGTMGTAFGLPSLYVSVVTPVEP